MAVMTAAMIVALRIFEEELYEHCSGNVSSVLNFWPPSLASGAHSDSLGARELVRAGTDSSAKDKYGNTPESETTLRSVL